MWTIQFNYDIDAYVPCLILSLTHNSSNNTTKLLFINPKEQFGTHNFDSAKMSEYVSDDIIEIMKLIDTLNA